MALKYWDNLLLKNGNKVHFVPPPPDGDRLGGITAAEKTKLDAIELGANKTVVDSELSDSSINPVLNKVVNLKISSLLNDITSLESKKQDTISDISEIRTNALDAISTLGDNPATDENGKKLLLIEELNTTFLQMAVDTFEGILLGGIAQDDVGQELAYRMNQENTLTEEILTEIYERGIMQEE